MELEGYSNLTRFTEGGMATLYRARQDSLDRPVVVKFLSAENLWDDSAREFFGQESLVIARLSHPNIIKVIDRGINARGRPYFVMEFIDGQDLQETVKNKKLSTNLLVQLLIQVCRGMAFAHKNGVVHRDIKPSNILIDKQSHVHILDFGIALIEAGRKPQAGEIFGTPDYMSPEQFSNPEAIDYRSDFYSLGAMMFHLFTDAKPAEHMGDLDAAMQSLPPDLSKIIAQCLQSDPQKRPASADEIAFRLLKVLQGKHIRAEDRQEAKNALGQLADKFQLLEVISRNKFSAVYLFQDKQRKSLMVVKKRLKSQAGFEIAGKLQSRQHDNIVRILGTSKNPNAFIVVMEYLAGGNLQDRLVRPSSIKQFLPLAKTLCQTMQDLHAEDICHGNIRPSNILFGKKDQVRLSDFGFDHHYQGSREEDWYQPQGGDIPGRRKDIYSLGVIFHQMLTGELPKIILGRFKPGDAFDQLPDTLADMVQRMIEFQSVNRFDSFDEVVRQLNELEQAPDVVAEMQGEGKSGWLKWLLLLSGLSLVGLLTFLYFNPDSQQQLRSLFGF